MDIQYEALAISDPKQLVFGRSPRPVTTRSGVVIGDGQMIPELNFTLPTMDVTDETWPSICRHYREIAQGALARAAALSADSVILEFEAVPQMTARPDWGVQICEILLEEMAKGRDAYGLASSLRMTPNDNREMERPPVMREGPYFDSMLETFERCAAAGADLLSIESVGGKEVHDNALVMGDMQQVLFALTVMGVRDMSFLWDRIVGIANKHGAVPAGDTACGFGNTAMVLAEQKLISRVFAAVVRAVTAVRTLVCYERGAVGPGKDCGYENPILKAITGCPMSMEGKTAACAHLSPLGNIAAATCDVWSNESVQNLKLLGGMAPTCYMEQLIYDCRLMNQALGDGEEAARTMQKWLVESDAHLDPQAYILTPENAIGLAEEIVQADDHYQAGRRVALRAVTILRDGVAANDVRIPERDMPLLDLIEETVSDLPENEDAFIEATLPLLDTTAFIPEQYELI